jgi:hypothetical protein
MSLAIRLGDLAADGFAIRRSGVHWLCSDGHACRPGEVIGYCNLAIEPVAIRRLGASPFADEQVLQVAFAPCVGGRLRIAPGASVDGYLNVLAIRPWNSRDVIGRIEDPDGGEPEGAAEIVPRRLMLAGRRMGWAVDVDTGLLPGWHSRARAWWDDEAGGPLPTLLTMGVCDAVSVVRGDRSGFVEIFEAASFGAQIITFAEHPIAACAPVALDQLLRTASERAAIRADIGRALASAAGPPTPEDCLFLGAILTQLEASPMRDRLDILTAGGLARTRAPDAVLMSLSAEPRALMRHRGLGFRLHILGHNLRAAGPLARHWLKTAFEPVARDLEGVRQDYTRLIGAAARTGARLMIVNRMSTSGSEDITSYAGFDAPLGDTLSSIAAQDMNLMLEDLARDHPVDIVDADAIAAEIGGREHLPDGIHQSGLMQSRLRSEILRHLHRGRQSTMKSTSRSAAAVGESGSGSS